MFEIQLQSAGKRYNRDWVFRKVDRTFTSGNAYALLGGNGSGKSTLVRSLIGYAPLSEGVVAYKRKGETLSPSSIYRHVSFCGPYLELYEELTLQEIARFHFSLKPALKAVNSEHFAELIGLEKAANKDLRYFSSGMKQRVRIGLAILSDTDAVCFDEPTSNLDAKAEAWFGEMIQNYRGNRLIVVASNHRQSEYFFCDHHLEMEDCKPKRTARPA